MKNLTLRNIALATGGTYLGSEDKLDVEISAVTTDSRKASSKALFAAIEGEQTDGHKYVRLAWEKGACACLVEKDKDQILDLLTASETEHSLSLERKAVSVSLNRIPMILVPSTGKALMALAEFYLRQLNVTVVSIIGSVGKTSTKEMVASVLEQKYRVLKTEGNFNNELGLPLTIFRLTEEDQIAVLEMGIDDFGQMRRMAKIARPDTVVMTNIGTCHLDHLKNRQGVWRAKSEVFDYIRPGGHAVFNGDDDILAGVKEIRKIKPVHFGLSRQGADGSENSFWADDIEELGFDGVSCRIHIPAYKGMDADHKAGNNTDINTDRDAASQSGSQTKEETALPVHIHMPGRHMVLNALAGAAVGRIYGLSDQEIKDGIEKAQTISGRFHIIKGERFTIIDDCYNANPMSMKASLSILGSKRTKDAEGRRVAILGDMGELGTNEAELHAEVGTFAAGLDLDLVCCAGPLSKNIAKAIQKGNESRPEGKQIEVKWYVQKVDLEEEIPNIIQEGDTILVKASHFMKFEELVKQLEEMDEKKS